MGDEHQMLETALRIFEIGSILGGGAVILFKLGRAIERFEGVGKIQGGQINEMKESIKSLADLMTKQALASQRMDNFGDRMNRQDKLLDDLRRGEGFIYPLGTHMAQPAG